MLLYGFETAEQTRRMQTTEILGCIQKFPDWPPGVRTANGTTLWYHYFVNQSSEFCHRNPLCSFSTSVYEGKKVKLSLCLTEHHAMKAYWGVKV
jgi:hypothetical protein